MFADDDEDDLELVTGFFKEFESSVRVLEFSDGKQVLKHLEAVSSSSGIWPQLIVLDINMPRMDGISTLVAIREQRNIKNVPVVIYTTSMSRTNMQTCKELDATWLIKPSSIHEIKQTARLLAGLCNNHLS
ncbi:MAG: response regulator [Flavisolibacter sp.]